MADATPVPSQPLRFWGGPADGAVSPGRSAYGIFCDGGVYRWDADRGMYTWRQHRPALESSDAGSLPWSKDAPGNPWPTVTDFLDWLDSLGED